MRRNSKMKKILQLINGLNQAIKLTAVALLVFAVAYSFGSCGKQTELDAWKEKYETYQEEVKITLQQNDSLKKVMNIRTDSIRRDSIKAARQTREINRLRESLGNNQEEKTRLEEELDNLRQLSPDTSLVSLKKDTIITLLRDDSTRAHTLIDSLESRDSTRVNEIELRKKNEADAIRRAESAEQKLRELPDAPKDPDRWFFGLFKKPSRGIVAITAAAGGVIIGALLAGK